MSLHEKDLHFPFPLVDLLTHEGDISLESFLLSDVTFQVADLIEVGLECALSVVKLRLEGGKLTRINSGGCLRSRSFILWWADGWKVCRVLGETVRLDE